MLEKISSANQPIWIICSYRLVVLWLSQLTNSDHSNQETRFVIGHPRYDKCDDTTILHHFIVQMRSAFR
jgi:hypothetical protein